MQYAAPCEYPGASRWLVFPDRLLMNKNTGIKRIFMAGVYSIQGIRSALIHEAAFRQEMVLAVVAIPLAVWLDVPAVERILLISVIVLILIVELVNSAIEAVVDRFGGEMHELSGRAKDMGSAAVLFALLLAVYVWVDVLLL